LYRERKPLSLRERERERERERGEEKVKSSRKGSDVTR
jgi:hypothetical protein